MSQPSPAKTPALIWAVALLSALCCMGIILVLLARHAQETPKQLQPPKTVHLSVQAATEQLQQKKPPPPKNNVTQRPSTANVPALAPLHLASTSAPPLQATTPQLATQALHSGWYKNFAAKAAPEVWDEAPQRISATHLADYYPRHALRRGLEGQTRVQFEVDKKGRVQHIKILKANPPGVFDAAAKRLIATLRYRAARRQGQPVASRVILELQWQPPKAF